MQKRELYKLTKLDDYVIEVIRTDNNYGLQGYVYRNGSLKVIYSPRTIPHYIYKECLSMFIEGN